MITVLESCLLQQGDLGGRAGNRGQVLDVVHATPGDLGTAGVGHVAAGIAVRLAGRSDNIHTTKSPTLFVLFLLWLL